MELYGTAEFIVFIFQTFPLTLQLMVDNLGVWFAILGHDAQLSLFRFHVVVVVTGN